ncbi:hypothetical protein GUJ93_ZPchr0012g21869 [Zizania palustris]|uniref:Uncharacterized protein n=1 Tax=Zizania palustris TaxID=103762 RepID=A0A8J6BR38_ZIZPA|nr:hypothetical protein GUJ93_ZPchr0012g21869 [Zizania palustris]
MSGDAAVGGGAPEANGVPPNVTIYINESTRRSNLRVGSYLLMMHQLISNSSSDQNANNYIGRKLLIGGFVEVQASAASSQDIEQSVTIKAKKASWSMGSSFPLKKATKGLPKIQIDDDSELRMT